VGGGGGGGRVGKRISAGQYRTRTCTRYGGHGIRGRMRTDVEDGVYLRPVSGCIRPWCVLGVTFALAGCFGLLTLVLLLANSSRMVCGMSGSNRTPCCRNRTHNNEYSATVPRRPTGSFRVTSRVRTSGPRYRLSSENRSDARFGDPTSRKPCTRQVLPRVYMPRRIEFVRFFLIGHRETILVTSVSTRLDTNRYARKTHFYDRNRQ